MKYSLQPPRVEKESEYLFTLVAQRALDDAFPIVAMDGLRARHTLTPWATLMEIWTERGFGRVVIESDGYGEQSLWSFSDEGLAEGKRLLARQRRSSWRAKARRQIIPLLALLASLLAAAAAAFSAYFSYLGLQG